MSQFGAITLTNKGKTLHSKVQTGLELRFTRIAVGDGRLNGESILSLNGLISEKKTLQVTKLKSLSVGQAVVGTVLSNQDITTGFYLREIGVFAQDPDIGEILYCYGNAGDLGEFIPAKGGPDVIEKTMDIFTVIGNASNVTAVIDESLVYETKAGVQEKIFDLQNKAQMTKITSDTGGVKLSISSTSGDILKTIENTGVGFYTFYAIAGSQNLPANGATGSIRGISQITSPGYGWIWATDYKNNIYTNYLDNGTWRGWHHLVATDDIQNTLWTGNAYMNENPAGTPQTVVPTKKLTECRNGWILVWSDYDAGVGANDYDFCYSYVPKLMVSKHNGGSHLFPVGSYLSATTVITTLKKIRVYDDKITGHLDNQSANTSTNDVCLRYVLEW